MTTDQSFDFAVIGGGSAGYAAARTAASLGLSTAVIDGAAELGGLCILRGCMPSKTLIQTGNVALKTRHAERFGVRASFSSVDTVAVRERKRTLIADFAGYRQGQLSDGRFTLLRGTAAFADAHTLRVSLREGSAVNVSAKAILIATGSEISWPDVPGLREANPWTSDTALDAETVPESFIVLGGGAIALEMAHYLEAIGRQVTVIQRSPHLLRTMDPDIGDVVQRAFEHRGMAVHTGTRLVRVESSGAGRTVVFEKEGGIQEVTASQILLALGRHPAVAALAPEAAGVALKNGRVAVSGTMQTSVPHIFAAGDVCGEAEVVHIAIQQAELAARNVAALLQGRNHSMEEMDYRLRLFGVFTEPQAAAVGMNEAEAAASGRPWRSATYPFNDHGKSMVMGETDGFVKMIADTGTGEILGASAVGPEATELIHMPAAAMRFRCTARQFLDIPAYHPTLSEIWSYPAEELI